MGCAVKTKYLRDRESIWWFIFRLSFHIKMTGSIGFQGLRHLVLWLLLTYRLQVQACQSYDFLCTRTEGKV